MPVINDPVVSSLPLPQSVTIKGARASLPEYEQPQNPVVVYLQNQLGAKVNAKPLPEINILNRFGQPVQYVSNRDLYEKGTYGHRFPPNRGDVDALNSLANLPVIQGGLQDSNLATRPELYLGKHRPNRFLIANANVLKDSLPDAYYNEGLHAASGMTLSTPTGQQVYINLDRATDSKAKRGVEGRTSPFATIVHELSHVSKNINNNNSLERAMNNYRSQTAIPKSTDYNERNGWPGLQQLSLDAHQQDWPSTTQHGEIYNSSDNIKEAVATALGLEAVMPRGQLPWDAPGGKELFNTPERKGFYVEATRGGREPIARNPDLYHETDYYDPNQFTPDSQDMAQRNYAKRGLGGWNALMNMRPVNQAIKDLLR